MNASAWKRIRPTKSGCWEWLGTKGEHGRGTSCVGRVTVYVHRLIYHLFVASVRGRMWIRQTCGNPACCNPEHLLETPYFKGSVRGENQLYTIGRDQRCVRGHDLTDPSNLVRPGRPGTARCRECRREYLRWTGARHQETHGHLIIGREECRKQRETELAWLRRALETGLTQRAMATELGISRSTCRRRLRELARRLAEAKREGGQAA